MGAISYINDRLVNLVSRLGTGEDKSAQSQYTLVPLTDHQLEEAYRSAWLPRKIVDIPAFDATRRWRTWQAQAEEISLLEAEEKRLQVKLRVLTALIRARLYGGAGIYIGTGDRDPTLPLVPERLQKGGVQFLTVLSRGEITAGEIEDDPTNERYGRPRHYILGNNVHVHPSRLAVFTGNELPTDLIADAVTRSWGDSILQSVYNQVQQADNTSANIAALVFEAKVDVFKIPNFMRYVGEEDYRNKVVDRVRLAANTKGNLAALLMDAEEDYEQKQLQFNGMTDILMAFMQLCSGAADIPLTRLLGQSPGGLNSSGEHDLKNYYDRVSSIQELEVEPAIAVLDECLIRSALGKRPDELHYTWRSLWQTSETERSENSKRAAETIKTVMESGLIPEGPLAQAAVNLLTESGAMPGLEAAVGEWSAGTDLEEGGADEGPEERRAALGDAAPRALYVRRDVLNANEIRAWAREQGIEPLLSADDMHVTIAFSRMPVDWMEIGESFQSELELSEGGPRMVERLGKDGSAVVLLFASSELSWRHQEARRAGASWDWPEYQPHITLSHSYTGDISGIEPYEGRILLGPEVFEELDPDWRAKVEEDT